MSTAFTATQVIDRPAGTVWQVLTDWHRAPDWMSGVDSVTPDDDVTTTPLWRPVAPALRALIRRTDCGQLDALKRLVESA
jgi:uncharacterized membrane protein